MGQAAGGRSRIFWSKSPKKERGRPKSGISEAARKLPIKGGTHAAKRKRVERAQKVADILPEVKEAIKKAGLDKNRSKYLKIADEKTLEAQLSKVQELTVPKSNAKSKRSFGPKQKAKVDAKTKLSAEETESFDELIGEWDEAPKLKRLFVDASANVRERFIAEIRRSTADD